MDPLSKIFRTSGQVIKPAVNVVAWPLRKAWAPLYNNVLDPQVALERGWSYAHKPPALSEKKKKELMEASSLETPRSTARALWGILSPYWTKSGPKEIMAGGALLAASLMMTWYAVQVTVEFGEWLGLVKNSLVQMYNEQSSARPEIVNDLINTFPAVGDAFEKYPLLKDIIVKYPDATGLLYSPEMKPFLEENKEWVEILRSNPSLEEMFKNFPGLAEEIKKNPEILQQATDFKNELGQRIQDNPGVTQQYKTIGSLFGSDFFNGWANAFTTWKKDAFKAAWEAKDFATLALKFTAMTIISFKSKQYLGMRWRAWSTGYYANKWQNNKAFQRIKNQFNNVDNPDQRLQEDPAIFTTAAISISTGLLSAGMTFASFANKLWDMGSFNLMVYGGPNIEVPGAMMFFAVGWAGLITGTTMALGWKLPHIERMQQYMEGNFRSSMKLAHEFADQIALEKGEKLELDTIKKNFKPVMTNSVRDLNVNTRLVVADAVFGNLAYTVPKLIGSGLIGAGQMTIGAMDTMGYYLGRVTSSLSFITNRWSQLTKVKATADRIYMMDRALEAAHYLEHEKQFHAAASTDEYLTNRNKPSGGISVPTPKPAGP